MNFTFGIITTLETQRYLEAIIVSIRSLNIPEYEIIIVGGNYSTSDTRIKHLPFDETRINNHITLKKNIITYFASYENIVYLHDYIEFESGWYEGFLRFNEECGGDWQVAMCVHKNIDDTRGIDWIGLPNDTKYGNVLLPYTYSNPKGMYIPGNFWVAKSSIMEKYPLNIHLLWMHAEDIEWSKRVLGGAVNSPWLRSFMRIPIGIEVDESECTDKYKMNTYSVIRYLKNKPTNQAFLKEYDLHSGDNSRPIGFKRDNYEYLLRRAI